MARGLASRQHLLLLLVQMSVAADLLQIAVYTATYLVILGDEYMQKKAAKKEKEKKKEKILVRCNV